MRIHYVTNDPDDAIFELAEKQPRIFPYFISEKKAITLMMKMDADVVVSTQEDLDNYYIKKSYLRDDIEYAFMFHHMTSTHLTALEKSYDNFDTILCVGPHQVAELRRAEELRDLKPKRLIECGYNLLDRQIASYGRNCETPPMNVLQFCSVPHGSRTTCSISASMPCSGSFWDRVTASLSDRILNI